jgi:hypothetical protein
MLLRRSIQRGATLNKLNRRYYFLIIVLILLVPLCFNSCKKDYKIALENSIRKQISGDKNAFAEIEENFVNAVSIINVHVEKRPIIRKIVFTQDNDNYEAVYPLNFEIDRSKLDIRLADYNNEIVVLSDGLKIIIAETDGKIVKIFKPGIEDSLIKDVLIDEKNIIYYLDEKLHYYNYKTEETGILHNTKLSPPYTKFFTVSLSRAGKEDISIVAGSGGVYYLYIYNRAAGELRLTKYRISTSKLLYSDNSLYLIKGNTGNWKLVKLNVNEKSEEIIDRFSSISDIELIPDGYIYHIEDTLWYKDFKGYKIRIPFKYRISGKINNNAILKFKNRLFVINWEKLNRKIKHFQTIIPEIFEDEEKKQI